MTELSVVIPLYNEAATLDLLLESLDQQIIGGLPDTVVTVVDDASQDGSSEILDRATSTYPWLRVAHNRRNVGHGPSVARGLDLADGQWVFQLDSDLETNLEDFWLLWPRRAPSTLVLGVRGNRSRPRHRRLVSRAAELVTSFLAGRRIQDPNVPFRIFPRTLWQQLRPGFPDNPLAPSLLLSLGAARQGDAVIEVPIRSRTRRHGSSSLRAGRLALFSLLALRQLLAYRASH